VPLIQNGQTQGMLVHFRIAATAHYHIALARHGYNRLMPRAASLALLIASILAGSLQAQRATATFHGSPARLSVRSGFVGQRGFPNRFFSTRSHPRYDSFGSFLVPYDEPFGYEQPDAEGMAEGAVSSVIILQPYERQSREPEPPAPKPLVIEIPGVANSTAVKMLPPTIFILANGERMETRRFVLTVSNLSVSIDRQDRTVPLEMLDINATTIANHERGIDLRIPADRSEISLSF
jgi:hypothetical protein